MTQNDIEPTPQSPKEAESDSQAPMAHSPADDAASSRQEWLGQLIESVSHSPSLVLAVGATLAALTGLVVPAAQSLLFAVAATGFVGSFLLVLLTPTPTVAAPTANGVYAAGAANQAALIEELECAPPPLYVPAAEDGVARLWLHDPRAGAAVPVEGTRSRADPVDASPLRTDGSDGLVLEPTGAGLVREFERSVSGSLVESSAGSESESESELEAKPESESNVESKSDAGSRPESAIQPEDAPLTLAETLAEGLTESLELTTQATVDEVTDTSATIAVTDCAFGDLEQFDHPVASFLASGFATGLERPVGVTVTPGSGDRADWVVECVWEA